MSRINDAQKFADLVRNATSIYELQSIVEGMVREIGFRIYGFGHHFDNYIFIKNAFYIHNYPSNWAEPFITRNYYLNDPIARACKQVVIPYKWEDLGRIISVTSKEHDLMQVARGEGLDRGFTIPLRDSTGHGASFNFVSPTRRNMTDADYFLAHMVAQIAFEAAQRIQTQSQENGADNLPRLTERQRQCLILAAQGKTDLEISRILGITHETVALHIKNARERFGVTKRISVIVRALHDGAINFSDVVE